GVTVSGSGFRGISQGSSGNAQDSPADYPVVELMSIHSRQAVFLLATNWSTDSVVSPPPPVSGLPHGYFIATVFVNGIPSPGQIFQIPALPIVGNVPSRMLPLSIGLAGLTVSFSGIPGGTYILQRAPALVGPWRASGAVRV